MRRECRGQATDACTTTVGETIRPSWSAEWCRQSWLAFFYSFKDKEQKLYGWGEPYANGPNPYANGPLVKCQMSYGSSVALRACMAAYPSKTDLVEERLIELAATIINFSAKIPRTAAGRHIA